MSRGLCVAVFTSRLQLRTSKWLSFAACPILRARRIPLPKPCHVNSLLFSLSHKYHKGYDIRGSSKNPSVKLQSSLPGVFQRQLAHCPFTSSVRVTHSVWRIRACLLINPSPICEIRSALPQPRNLREGCRVLASSERPVLFRTSALPKFAQPADEMP